MTDIQKDDEIAGGKGTADAKKNDSKTSATKKINSGAPDYWNGSLTTLLSTRSVKVSRTANATSVLATVQSGVTDRPVTLVVTSGPAAVQVPVPPPNALPKLLVANWRGNPLTAENVLLAGVPVRVQLTRMNLGGVNPVKLSTRGVPVTLQPSEFALALIQEPFFSVKIEALTQRLTLVALIGGPVDDSGTNAHVYALNAPTNTRGAMGYDSTTTLPTEGFELNWGGPQLFVQNLSMTDGAAIRVTVTSL